MMHSKQILVRKTALLILKVHVGREISSIHGLAKVVKAHGKARAVYHHVTSTLGERGFRPVESDRQFDT